MRPTTNTLSFEPRHEREGARHFPEFLCLVPQFLHEGARPDRIACRDMVADCEEILPCRGSELHPHRLRCAGGQLA